MNVDEASEYLGISGKTLRKLIKEGELSAMKIPSSTGRTWYIDELHVNAYNFIQDLLKEGNVVLKRRLNSVVLLPRGR